MFPKPNLKVFYLFVSVLLATSLACGLFSNPANPPDLSDVEPSLTEPPVATHEPIVVEAETCTGPGILETPVKGINSVIRVDTGLSFAYSEGLGWCEETSSFQNQDWLIARWPKHLEEFFAKPENKDGTAYVLLESGSLEPYDPDQGVLGVPAQPTQLAPQTGQPVLPDPSTMITPEAGKLAWCVPNKDDGETHSVTPVGQLGSDLRILGETWDPNGSYVFVVPAGAAAWLQGFYGGCGWWIANDVNIEELANQHADALEARDGVRPTIVILPEDAFEILGCLQSKPVSDDMRPCDSVAGYPAYTVAAGAPLPGYFPQSTLLGGGTVVAGACTSTLATGPAVVETTIGGTPTIVRVDEGKEFPFTGGGCNPYESQAKLLTDFPAWVRDFLAKWPDGNQLIAP